ncbi:dihydroorotase [Larkinella knui]|uniref:Dihydroorotase n=1 Tax=Larkinella knui TaxID=2025310 RepID=A0A3P1CKX6_9BACT|nr:dihydroorotase [Larkinella knui]RRB13981.1 dihydroorotase [Larkinella knui]
MKLLIRAARIVDAQSPFNGQVRDVLLENGLIRQIGESLSADADESGVAVKIIEQAGLCISPGWVDLRVSAKDPGYEQKEDLTTVCRAAMLGGFTDIAILPNTKPVLDSKDTIGYVRQATLGQPVNVHAIAAITKRTEGQDFTDMIDLHHAGAVAFSDGEKPLTHPDLLLKTLQYLRPFNGLLMNRPEEQHLTLFGQMNEGLSSTLLGLKGMPAMAEEMMIERDLRILDYLYPRTPIRENPAFDGADFDREKEAVAGGDGGSESQGLNGAARRSVETPVLHFSTISTARAVDLIRQAKQQGLPVSCDMAAHQLAFTDSALMGFDTNLKVNPPFRLPADLEALKQGLADGTIDAIVSDHNPQDDESKNIEFDHAEFGLIGLETAFAVVRTHYPEWPLEPLIEALTHRPRQILRLPSLTIDENQPATLTVFDPDLEWTYERTASRSKNSPFFGKTLRGKALWIINKGFIEHL